MSDQQNTSPPVRMPASPSLSPAQQGSTASGLGAPTMVPSTRLAAPMDPEATKPARARHILGNARIAGDDGRLAKVGGNGFALADPTTQGKVADILISGSKRQFRRELLDACLRSEVPVSQAVIDLVLRG